MYLYTRIIIFMGKKNSKTIILNYNYIQLKKKSVLKLKVSKTNIAIYYII